MPEHESPRNINRLLDVEMNVTVRFGKTEMPLKDVVHFGVGSMLELNRTVDEPVELLVNNYPFARGEVVVIDGYYGVRVTEIGTAEERTQTLFPTPDTEEPTVNLQGLESGKFNDPIDEFNEANEPDTNQTVAETEEEPVVEPADDEKPAEEE